MLLAKCHAISAEENEATEGNKNFVNNKNEQNTTKNFAHQRPKQWRAERESDFRMKESQSWIEFQGT